MSGLRLFWWASSWKCSLITPSTIINFQRHGFPSAISDHLFSFFRARASSWRVLLVVLLKRGYLRPCALVFAQYVLGCSSSVPPRHRPTPGKLLPVCFSDSGRACPTSLLLFSAVPMELHERGVTSQTCLPSFEHAR